MGKAVVKELCTKLHVNHYREHIFIRANLDHILTLLRPNEVMVAATFQSLRQASNSNGLRTNRESLGGPRANPDASFHFYLKQLLGVR